LPYVALIIRVMFYFLDASINHFFILIITSITRSFSVKTESILLSLDVRNFFWALENVKLLILDLEGDPKINFFVSLLRIIHQLTVFSELVS
jgi:hypothetical protein